MCVNSICARPNPQPSLLPSCLATALCTAVACFLDRRFELFIESSRFKQWIGDGFTVRRPCMHTTQQPPDDEVASRSSRVNVGCTLSSPGLLLHFYLRTDVLLCYDVITSLSKRFSLLRAAIKSIYCEDVNAFMIKQGKSTEVTLA